ncbi:MAG: ABC transporter ATP-binding protein [Ancylobacter novellus]|uniref:ABC transporter ATP-binding protein n=1 Tax=Ancylobacter novellus TaxID=921 RepID=A0A2W5KGB9_ANCNO|nr:MAG: ABC transporter ATP-binding protein [Ancylobacter novellus]
MSQAAQPLLAVSGLTKRYGAMAAISDLDFTVEAGTVFGITGPNGAGKTTLFDVISGVTPASAGAISFGGDSLVGLKPQDVCHRGLVRTFQLNAAFDTMTVEENALVSAYFGPANVTAAGLRFSRRAREAAADALAAVGLEDYAQVKAIALPVLQRKLLMLASAIACGPRLLMLDEPVGGLNARETEHCAAIIRTLVKERGVTIMVIEHVMRFMNAVADEVMILHHGRKLHQGPPASLAQNEEVVSVYLGSSGAEAFGEEARP